MTDDSEVIAYVEKLARYHNQAGFGCVAVGHAANLLGKHVLGVKLESVGLLTLLASIVLYIIGYVMKKDFVISVIPRQQFCFGICSPVSARK